MISKISFLIHTLILTLIVSSCSTPPVQKKKEMRIHAKVYSLKSGEVIEIVTKRVGNGKTRIVKSSKTRNGETFSGEFITLSNSSNNRSRAIIRNSQGKVISGKEFSQSSSNQQPGTGILIGNKGTVININYAISAISKNSVGTGTDNKGRKYKFTCCERKYLN